MQEICCSFHPHTFVFSHVHVVRNCFNSRTYFQDLALIEALWKQDVDLGVPREVYEDDGMDINTDTPSKDKDHGKKVSHKLDFST